MPDAESFLRAIIENPDDDGPRLVYADWLDENGDPDRAEFIRVQIALARNGTAGRPQLYERQVQLLARHRREWSSEAESVVRTPGQFFFRRGFVDDVDADAFEFVERAADLYRRTPVQHLRLRPGQSPPHENAQLMRRLAGSPELVCLRSLSLAHNRIGSDGMEALAVCQYLGRLQSLNLGNNHIGERGVRALVEAPWFANLTSLDLTNNDVNAAAAHALAVALDELEAADRLLLRELSLAGNPLHTAGMRVIRASPALRRVARV